MKTTKTIFAIIAGFLTVVILSTVTDFVLEKLGILPSPKDGLFITWMLVLALAYRSIYTVVGGYVTAWLAPERPIHVVKILAFIGLLAGIVGIVFGWNLSQHWYPIAIAITGPIFTILGGFIRVKNAQL